MDEYYRWADVPDNVKTKNQLSKLGLRPAKGQAVVAKFYGYGVYDLYDVGQAIPKRKVSDEAKKRFQDNLAKYRQQLGKLKTCPYCGEYSHWEGQKEERQRWRKKRQYVCTHCKHLKPVVKLARELLANPKTIILDSETTGLELKTDQIVQLAVINIQGETLLNTLLKPTIPVSPGARAVHGISDATLETAPTYPDIAETLHKILAEASAVVIYNRTYDINMLANTAKAYDIHQSPEADWACAMNMYATYIGQWSEYWGGYKFQSLPGGDHTALGDCLATLDVLKEIANCTKFDEVLVTKSSADMRPGMTKQE